MAHSKDFFALASVSDESIGATAQGIFDKLYDLEQRAIAEGYTLAPHTLRFTQDTDYLESFTWSEPSARGESLSITVTGVKNGDS